MKNFSKTTFIISAIILAVIAVVVFLYLHRVLSPSSKIDYSKQYPESASDISGFENKKTGSVFTVYYHPADEAKANKALAILEQASLDLYQKYLGLKPEKILVYIADDINEYVKIADFPGGREQVQIGDGSAPDGNIYLYRPFGEFIPGKTEGMLIHEGTHATMYKFLGREGMGRLPSFLNEGLAHFMEYTFEYGKEFQPLDQMNPDFWLKVIKTGNPALMTLNELAKNCEGYIADENRNTLCRSQGTFVVWYVVKNYSQDAWANFLAYTKEGKDWQKPLEMISGKNLNQLNQDIFSALKLPVK